MKSDDTILHEMSKSPFMGGRFGDFLLRFGVVTAVLLLWEYISRLHNLETPGFTFPTWLSLVEYALSFAAVLMVARRKLADWMRILPLVLLLVLAGNTFLVMVAGNVSPPGPTSDIYVFSEYAAHLVRLGENPYTSDLYDGYRVMRMAPTYVTPLLRDGISGSAFYPPLFFLPLIPFQILNIPSYLVYGLNILLTLGVIYSVSPRIYRPVVLLPFFVVPGFLAIPLNGGGDTTWVLLVSLLVARWSHARERGLWYGLACSVKQNVWVFAPFLFIRVWRSDGRREALKFALASGGVFLLINAPFIIANPQAWLSAMFGVFTEAQIYLSHGPSRLTQLGILELPKSLFVLLTLAVILAAMLLYWWRGFRWSPALWLVPGIATWFSYRSLTHYWLFLSVPLWIEFLVNHRDWRQEISTLPVRPLMAKPVLVVAGLALAFVVVTAIGYATATPPLTLDLHWPVRTSDNRVQELRLTLTNNSVETIQPRFAVNGDFYHQYAYWNILRGPADLAPGERAEYIVNGTWPVWSFPYHMGSQLIASDDDNYDIRAFATLPEDATVIFPDVPSNSAFRYWRADQNAPTGWELLTTSEDPQAVRWYENDQIGSVLRLQMTGDPAIGDASVKLSTRTFFPEVPLQLWVNLPANANLSVDSTLFYGVELLANGHQLWVLFGDQYEFGELRAGLRYVMLPAPRERWSLQTLNVHDLFDTVGIDIPTLSYQSVPGFDQLNFPRTALTFRLLFAARSSDLDYAEANFGSLVTAQLLPNRRQMVIDALEHPDRMLLWRGDENRESGNDALAQDFYQRALEANPNSARAYIGLGWLAFDQARYTESADHFQHAVDLITGNLQAYDLPSLGEAQAGLGWILVRQGDCDTAMIYIDQARRLESSLNYASLTLDLAECP